MPNTVLSRVMLSNNSTINNNHNNDDHKHAWAENLKRNEEQRKRDSQWFTMDPGDKTVLKFLPQFGPVWKDFDGDGEAETLRYEYNIIDLNNQDLGSKPWDVSKTWSEEIDYHLSQGHYILKVERIGSGMKTKYHFTPVDPASSGAATSSS